MTNSSTVSKNVKEYYGEILKTKEDLKTSACCPIDAMPEWVRPLVANVHDEVQAKFYGCGSPIPHAMEGLTALDLGCGTGRDVYTLSQVVGEKGHVIGVDMTENQLAVANKTINYHMDKFGFSQPNVKFHKGYIEDLKSLGIEDNSIDVVTSNCVINLSPNKEDVFREIFRVLKPGGELYFSDVFTDRRVPKELVNDPVLHGECLSGAMYIEDFRRMLRQVGCLDYRIVSSGIIELNDPEVERQAGMIKFYSMTVRVFKCEFEDICEDYGQVAYYLGTIDNSPHSFVLDNHHEFKTGQPMLVCSNTAAMLSETHYAPHFKVLGDTSTHYGAFDCGPDGPAQDTEFGACC